MDDFKNFGIDFEKELIETLSNELRKSIDAEILKGLGIVDSISIRKSKIDRIKEKLK